ncbi:hypothetical protein CLAFUW4_11760 [Fulvia fulva]|uniref:F-box domain-containing protein n=1 Tax=Passalora fulva TaxID=5499 RepID=A0A9Q8USR8_PASFU|nr:uncharacterized protein CLAFUR5_10804 [Fulvia fulva]KAK4618294.1 hypothetical protein CLAFUR4_11765 [Fulvia fulva]KAK4618762.1 hypothetical protein CLAFUR0_11778 [Fulvia fulva]UJO21040.1 hypothetical protein CLAFUR5_10804 [Fulvia fulva]WPV18509.1 hypothetical protein CLAFUW4_11760 [Fulvia fulva]WPV32783.1 hypothetical protein CLAFUW7_11767 [Fulvia fulva]
MATTTTPSNTAALRTFGVTELLEQILSDLDMQTLLLAQRVSKQWKDTIADSSMLQEALFSRLQTTHRNIYHGHGGENSFVSLDSSFSRPLVYYNDTFVVTFSYEQFKPNELRLNFRVRTRDYWGDIFGPFGEMTELDGGPKPSWHRMYLLQYLSPAAMSWNCYHAVFQMEVRGVKKLKEFEEEWHEFDWDQKPLASICEDAIKITSQRVLQDMLDGNVTATYYDTLTPYFGAVRR